MTRINSAIPPTELHRLHLIAEFREIIMVPAALRRSLRTKSPRQIIKEIPSEFTLNAGHVKFFYNKLSYLTNRFDLLADEMEARGYRPDRNRKVAFDGFDLIWMGNWEPTQKANDIVKRRIADRILEKPHLYKDELDR